MFDCLKNLMNFMQSLCLYPFKRLFWYGKFSVTIQHVTSRSIWKGTPHDHQEVPDNHIALAQCIWNYMLLDHTIQKSDVILVLGNHDPRTAGYGADLWLQGLGSWILFSGNVGMHTKGKWSKTEAEIFSEIAIGKGVDKKRILLETEATNTGENVQLSYQVLRQRNIISQLHQIILVQMPHMERRTYATFMKQWPGFKDNPELSVRVTSPRISMLDYPSPDVGTLRDVICVLMGCLHRIQTYPQLGFQIQQNIPTIVVDSYNRLLQTNLYNTFVDNK